MMDKIINTIKCEQQCEIPEGVVLVETPPSRHDWSDVVRCPNEGCERTFLVVDSGDGERRGSG
jgi:hypothetical protein